MSTNYPNTISKNPDYLLGLKGGNDVLVPAGGPGETHSMPYVLAQSHATSGSVTGTTGKTTLATLTIPAGCMGPNGTLRIRALASITNNANNKTLGFDLNGTNVGFTTGASNTTLQYLFHVNNRGSQGSQVSYNTNNGTSASITLTSIDTSKDAVLTITGQLGLGSDTMTLESYGVEVLPGA